MEIMSLLSISKSPFTGMCSYQTFPKKAKKFSLNNLEFIPFEKKNTAFSLAHFDLISLQKSSPTIKRGSKFEPLIYRLKNPQKDPLTLGELENFLDEIAEGNFEKNISPNEMSTIMHLLIDYARQGTKDPLEQQILEEEIQNLFKEKKIFPSSNSIADSNFFKAQANLCFKKQGGFKTTCSKFGNFIKKHKKAIIIGVSVVAAVAVVALVTLAIVNTVAAAIIAEATAASGAASAGVAGVVQSSEQSEINETEQITEEDISSKTEIPGQSLQNNTDLNKLLNDPFEETTPENIALFQNLSESPNEAQSNLMYLGSPPNLQIETDIFQEMKKQTFLDAYTVFEKEANLTLNPFVRKEDQLLVSEHHCQKTNELEKEFTLNPVIDRPPSKLKNFPNFEEVLLATPLESDVHGIPYAKPVRYYQPSQVLSIGEKQCVHGKSLFMNGIMTTHEEAIQTAQAISEMQSGNKIDLVYNSTLGLQRDLIKQKLINDNYLTPAA